MNRLVDEWRWNRPRSGPAPCVLDEDEDNDADACILDLCHDKFLPSCIFEL
jgi:hypothetical protein